MLFVALHLLLMQGEQTKPDASDWKRQGLAMAAENSSSAAVGPLTKACELDPKDEDACYYLARILHASGRWDEARVPFEKALRAAPRRMLARVHRAVALNFMALGRMVEAEQNFKTAIAMRQGSDSLRDDPRIDYGAFLFRQGRSDAALQLLQEAVRDAPKSARAHAELAEFFYTAVNWMPPLRASKKQFSSTRKRRRFGFCLGEPTCRQAAQMRDNSSFNWRTRV